MSTSVDYRDVFWSGAPENWKHIKLGDVIKRVNLRYKDYDQNNIQVLTVTNDKGFIKPEEKFDKQVCSDDLEDYKVVKKGQFAYNPSRINVGSIAFLEDFDTGLISPMYEVFEINDELVKSDFIKYFLKSYKAISLYDAFSQGSVRQTLKFDLMSDIPYVLPSIKEQEKITKLLSQADKVIEKVSNLIKKDKQLKKGLMQQLLTEGIGHDTFKEVKVPLLPQKWKIPESWMIKFLKDLTHKITDGAHQTPTYVDEGIPFLRVTDIQSPQIDWDNTKKIPVEEHEKLTKRCKPEKGDVLLAKNGTIGITKIVDWNKEFSNFVSLCLIKPNKDLIDPKYLSLILESPVCLNQAKIGSKTGTITNLHLTEIRKFNIPVPPLNEQKKIAKILSSVDAKIQKEQEYKEELEQVKKGLMQKLLTGEVRVPIEE